jgi:hypothetical protein
MDVCPREHIGYHSYNLERLIEGVRVQSSNGRRKRDDEPNDFHQYKPKRGDNLEEFAFKVVEREKKHTKVAMILAGTPFFRKSTLVR